MVIPSLAIFAVLSGPFIRFFLTDKWILVVPLIKWLCFARMFYPINAFNLTILTATGRSDLYLIVDSSKIPLLIVTLFITIPLGLKAIVIGNFVTAFLSFLINTYYPGKLYGFGAFRQIREMRFVIYASLIMSAGVTGIIMIIQSDFLRLLIGLPAGLIIFLGAAYILKIEELKEVTNALYSILGKNKTNTQT